MIAGSFARNNYSETFRQTDTASSVLSSFGEHMSWPSTGNVCHSGAQEEQLQRRVKPEKSFSLYAELTLRKQQLPRRDSLILLFSPHLLRIAVGLGGGCNLKAEFKLLLKNFWKYRQMTVALLASRERVLYVPLSSR